MQHEAHSTCLHPYATRPTLSGYESVLPFLTQAYEDTSKIPAMVCKPPAADERCSSMALLVPASSLAPMPDHGDLC